MDAKPRTDKDLLRQVMPEQAAVLRQVLPSSAPAAVTGKKASKRTTIRVSLDAVKILKNRYLKTPARRKAYKQLVAKEAARVAADVNRIQREHIEKESEKERESDQLVSDQIERLKKRQAMIRDIQRIRLDELHCLLHRLDNSRFTAKLLGRLSSNIDSCIEDGTLNTMHQIVHNFMRGFDRAVLIHRAIAELKGEDVSVVDGALWDVRTIRPNPSLVAARKVMKDLAFARAYGSTR